MKFAPCLKFAKEMEELKSCYPFIKMFKGLAAFVNIISILLRDFCNVNRNFHKHACTSPTFFKNESRVTIPTQANFYLQQYNHLYIPSLKQIMPLALSEYVINWESHNKECMLNKVQFIQCSNYELYSWCISKSHEEEHAEKF